MRKLLLILVFLLASCGGEDEVCEEIRVYPPDGPPYWVTVCEDESGNLLSVTKEKGE